MEQSIPRLADLKIVRDNEFHYSVDTWETAALARLVRERFVAELALMVAQDLIDMKARLYFTHKGTEKLFEGRQPAERLELAERISGDTSVGHSLAYCQALEAAARVRPPARALYLRVLLLELDRLYNPFGMVEGWKVTPSASSISKTVAIWGWSS